MITKIDSTSTQDSFLISQITYELFVSLVTLVSLILASIYYFFPFSPAVKEVIFISDSIIALVFIVDFFVRLYRRSKGKRYPYFVSLIDLLSGIPGIPFLRYLRIPRLLITIRLLRHQTAAEVRQEARQQLAQSTLLVTTMVALLVITIGSALVVSFEAKSPLANIQTGQEAVWWSLVTVATVGYGDYVPVTAGGRIIGSVMMVVGVSIFTVLTSFIASNFLYPNQRDQEEMATLRRDMAAIKDMLSAKSTQSEDPKPGNAPDSK